MVKILIKYHYLAVCKHLLGVAMILAMAWIQVIVSNSIGMYWHFPDFIQDRSNGTLNLPLESDIDHLTSDAITPIHDIQGAGHISPYIGQAVSTGGIVTVVRSYAFYMQDPNPDSDEATSEAIYVYTSTNPSVTVGDEVMVSGIVTEYRVGSIDTNLTLTEITNPTISIITSGNPLPTAIILGTGGRIPPALVIEDDASGDVEISGIFDPLTDGMDFYESLEGMLVQVNDAVAVAATNLFGEIAIVGDAGINGGLFSMRGSLIIQAGDMNPERILVDDSIVSNEPKVNVGASFNAPIIGVLDYSYGNFKLLNTQSLSVTDSNLDAESTSLEAAEDQITVATYNVENLDPSDGARFDLLAEQIVKNMLAPDIIALQEVQDNSGGIDDGTVDASLTYLTLIGAIQSVGGPIYDYRDIAPLDLTDGGEPGGNIRVGFLFRTDRGLSFIDRPGGDATSPTNVALGLNGVELSYSPGRIDPLNSAFLDSRKPLAGEFSFNGHKLIVIASHLNSKGDDDPLFGRYQPPALATEAQRLAQATVINAFVREILALDPNANIIVLGDLNDFQFSLPLQRLAGSELNILTMVLPPEERYTYNYEGNGEALDHILVSDALISVVEYDIVHTNSEFLDTNRPTDHDPAITRLTLPTTLEMSKSVSLPAIVEPGSLVTYSISLRNSGYDRIYNIELCDTLPDGITFEAWVENPGAVYSDGSITWTGSILEDLTFIFSAVIDFDVEPGSEIANMAQFEYPGGTYSVSTSFWLRQINMVALPLMFTSASP